MKEKEVVPVFITSFINPHLFWIFNLQDANKKNEMVTKLRQIKLVTIEGTINEVVIVRTGKRNELARAIIKHKETLNQRATYHCWLIDDGIAIICENVYEISEELKHIPPFAKAACLFNSVGCKMRMVNTTFKFQECSKFSAGVSKRFQQFISDSEFVFFYFEKKVNEILCGDIILVSNNKMKKKCKLTEKLIDGQNISIDKINFNKYLKENLQNLDENYLALVKTAVNFYEKKNEEVVNENNSDEFENHNRSFVEKMMNNLEIDINKIGIGRGTNSRRSLKKNGVNKNDDESDVNSASTSSNINSSSTCSNINECSNDTVSKSDENLYQDDNFEDLIEEVKDFAEAKDDVENHLEEIKSKILKNNSLFEELIYKDENRNKNVSLSSSNKISSNTSEKKTKLLTTVSSKQNEVETKKENVTTEQLEYESDDNDFIVTDKKHQIGCNCKYCPKRNVDDVTSKNTKINVEKPPLLFKTENDTSNLEIAIKTKTSMKKTMFQPKTNLEKFVDSKVVVHGITIPAPVDKVLQVPFNSKIHQFLTAKGIEHAQEIQSYAWPSLMRRMNVFMVGSPKAGKTMSYVPTIISYIHEKDERYPNLPPKNIGPIVLVICKGSQKCESVEEMFRNFRINSNRQVSVYRALTPLKKFVLDQFYQPFDILVTTPVTMFELLFSRIIDLKRLCHIVIEDLDVVLEKFPLEMNKIFNVIQTMLDNRLCNYPVQMISTSEKWTVDIEKLAKSLNYMPIICISNYFEAALYSRVDFEFVFVKEYIKKIQVIDIIEEKGPFNNILILCNTEDEVDKVLECLQLKSISAIKVTSKSSKEEIYAYEERWINTNRKNFVIVCTDETFKKSMDTTRCNILIHYSLPSTWTQFSYRFKSLTDNLTSPMSNKNNDQTYCKTYILVDQNSAEQFPRLIQLLQRLNKNIPSKFLRAFQIVTQKKEEQKIKEKVDICKNIKMFGKCDEPKCLKRHILSGDIDLNEFLPTRGSIKFRILDIKTVNTFYVDILSFIDADGNNVELNREDYEGLENKLQTELKEVYNGDIIVENIYGFFEDEKLKRCKVLQKLNDNSEFNSLKKEVIVKFLDYGHNKKIILPLYELPEEYKTIKPRAYTLHIGNVVPPEQDDRWNDICKWHIKNFLLKFNYFNENSYFTSEVLLLLNQELWVKNAYLFENLDTLQTKVMKLNILKELRNLKIVKQTEEPMNKLYNLCEKAGISLPDITLVKEKSENSMRYVEQVKPNWAFLNDDVDYNEVYLSNVQSPDKFYVRLKKYDDLLHKLEVEIKYAVISPMYPEKLTILEGCSCLGKDPESGNYRRIVVLSVENDEVDCMFVDYGRKVRLPVKDLKYINENFISKLPYQAIQCSLYGIQSCEGTWQPNANEILNRYKNEENNITRTFYLSFKTRQAIEEVQSFNYDSILSYFNKNNPIIFNQLLIDCGEAIAIDESIDWNFKFPKIDRENESVEEKAISNDSSYELFEAEIYNEEFFLEQVFGIKLDNKINENKTINKEPEKYLSEIKLLNKSPNEYLTPTVIWYQTDTHIHITIDITTNQYQLQLDRERFLNFKTCCKNKEYQLTLILFAGVKKDFKVTSGLNLKVTFEKIKCLSWKQLSIPSHKYIKYDINKINFPEEERRFLNINDADDDDDDEDDSGSGIIEIGSDADNSESDLESLGS